MPAEIVRSTTSQLQKAGGEGYELFVLWSGVVEEQGLTIRSMHVPPQTSYKTDEGLLVRVDGPALHDLNVWLFEHQEILAVQVHAHPDQAYHSETDDGFPIVTSDGGLSIVAASFARGGCLGDASTAYRLSDSLWDELATHEFRALVQVVG